MENGDERVRDITLLNVLDVQHAPSVIERIGICLLITLQYGRRVCWRNEKVKNQST